MWIPASAGMTKLGADDAPDNHGGIVPTIIFRGTTGAVDDWNVDSRSPFGAGDKLRGNDGLGRGSAPDVIEPRSTPARPVHYLPGFMDSRSPIRVGDKLCGNNGLGRRNGWETNTP